MEDYFSTGVAKDNDRYETNSKDGLLPSGYCTSVSTKNFQGKERPGANSLSIEEPTAG